MILIVAACLAAAPADCREERIPLAAPTPIACLAVGQPTLAEWAAAHPKWRIVGFRCVEARWLERRA